MKNPSEKSFQPWGASSQLAKREMRIRNAERKFEMQLVKDITNKSPEIPDDDCCLQEPYKHRCLTKDIRLHFVEDRSGKAAPSTHLHTRQHPGTGEQDQLHTSWLPTHIPPAPYLNKGGEEMPSHATNHSNTAFQQYVSRKHLEHLNHIKITNDFKR